MRRFVEGVYRGQTTLFPESLDDWVDESKRLVSNYLSFRVMRRSRMRLIAR
jgi:hypothetical protein